MIINTYSPARRLAIPLLSGCLFIVGCGKQPSAAADPPKTQAAEQSERAGSADADKKDESRAPETTLSPEQISKLGIVTAAARSVQFVPEKQGFGVVLGHEAIAQSVADVVTAEAGVRQSQAALARMDRLAGTAGAESAEARESALRQAAVDTAALRLAEAKSSSLVGQRPPWAGQEDSKLLADLAAGRAKLLRVTFPLGALSGDAPRDLRATRLGAASAGEGWTARPVWDAPADAGIPGRNFFALLQAADAAEGERVLVRAAGSSSAHGEAGALVPAEAAILSEGKYWCYLERQPGVFVRAPLDIDRPMADGYFIDGAIKPGDTIVTAGAGLLLARETNSGVEAD